jgi:hypothetical protein
MTEDRQKKSENTSEEIITIKPKPVGKAKGTTDIIKADLDREE